jgi:hypothetical protein
MAHAQPSHPAPAGSTHVAVDAHASSVDHDDPSRGAGHGPDDHPPVEPLGPPDLRAWGASLAGAGVAAMVAISLFVATQA